MQPTTVLTQTHDLANTDSLSQLFQSYKDVILEKGNKFSGRLDERLQNSARNNDDLSIEYLFTLAFEDSLLGKEAERFLFDLYTGKESAHSCLPQQLSKDSLRLYEIVEARNASNPTNETWKFPDKLLIMAGFSAQSDSQVRADIVDKINQNIPILSAYVEVTTAQSEGLDNSFFAINRLVTAAEINAVTQQLTKVSTRFHFLDSQAISTSDVENKHCSPELIRKFNDPDYRDSLGKFIPLLFRGHWVLFGVTVSNSGDKNAVLFDSSNGLTAQERTFILELSDQINAKETTFIDQNIQTHLPNACGLLVSKAQEWLAKNPEREPATILSNFSDHIQSTPAENLEIFNQHSRAEMYGNIIDWIRNTTN